jgi:hypothetical protein
MTLWTLSYICGWHSYLEQGSYGGHKGIGKDIHAKECRHSRIYYLVGNLEFLGEAWKNQGLELSLSAKTYIQSLIPKFEGLLSTTLRPSRHDSPLFTEDDYDKYRSIIGCCIWIIVLGRFRG